MSSKVTSHIEDYIKGLQGIKEDLNKGPQYDAAMAHLIKERDTIKALDPHTRGYDQQVLGLTYGAIRSMCHALKWYNPLTIMNNSFMGAKPRNIGTPAFVIIPFEGVKAYNLVDA